MTPFASEALSPYPGPLAHIRNRTAHGPRGRTLFRSLAILERWLTGNEFLTPPGYTIADISVFAYVSRAAEAGIPLASYPSVAAWVTRVRAQDHFLDTVHPYSIDPYSVNELP